MSVGEICNREVVIADPETTVIEAAKLMREHHVGDIVVVERRSTGPVPVGLITDRDIVIEVMALGLSAETLTVLDIMTRELETVSETEEFWDALGRMRTAGVRRMPIIDDEGRLEGIFTLDDALALIAEGMTDLAKLVDREIDRERETR